MKNEKIPETNLESLLDRIQAEGIQKAESTAAEIIKVAHEKADLIVTKARQDAEDISDENKEAIKLREASLNSRLTQAGRDVVLNVKGEIIALFEHLFQHKCQSYLQGKKLADMISQIIANWQTERHDSINLEVLVNEQDRQGLLEELLAAFHQQAKDIIEVKGHPDIISGFRIGIKDSHLYYDFTDQAIAETISQYLRPELAALLAV